MNQAKLIKLVSAASLSAVVGAVSKGLASRPDGTNPNHIRLIVIMGGAVAMEYGEAAIERFVNARQS